MSIFETQVKDVVQRADSDAISITGSVRTVDSEATVEAYPTQVILVDDESVGEAVTVELPEEPVPNIQIIVKKIGADSSAAGFDVTVTNPGDGQVVDAATLSSQNDTLDLVSDGTDYYAV